MRRIILGIAALFVSTQALAQSPPFPQTLPGNTVVGRMGVSPGPAQAIPFATFTDQIGGPLDPGQMMGNPSAVRAAPVPTTPMTLANRQIAKSENYTALAADRGTFALGGNVQFTLTFTAATNYDTNHSQFVRNADGWTSGRAKTVHSSAGEFSDCKLYPGQVAIVWRQAAGLSIDCPKRIPHPGGVLPLYSNGNAAAGSYKYISPSGGSSISGSGGGSDDNDGLSPNGPFATLQFARSFLLDRLDFNGMSGNPTRADIRLACSQSDPLGMHAAPHGDVGANGGAAISVTGCDDNSSIVGPIQAYQSLEQTFNYVKVLATDPNTHCFENIYGAHVYLNNITIAGCTGAAFFVGAGGSFDQSGPITVSGNIAAYLSNGGGYYFRNGGAISASAPVTMTGFLFASAGVSAFSGPAITGTWTGDQAFISGSSTVTSPAGDGVFPGTGIINVNIGPLDGGTSLSAGWMRSLNNLGSFSFTHLACDQPTNLSLTSSVAANNFTLAIKSAINGGDPSATSPVAFCFRDNTGNSTSFGVPVWVDQTSAKSFIATNGNTFGATNGVAFTLHIVAINHAGTVRIGFINVTDGSQIDPSTLHSTGAGTGGGNSAGVIYTDSASLTNVPIRVIGTLTWSSGLATAGVWNTAPDKVYIFGPDGILPLALSSLPVMAANTVLGNATSGAATPTAVPFSSIVGREGVSSARTYFIRSVLRTVTITIASPAVVTLASHGYADNTQVVFDTTSALPTGLTAGTVYYVINAAAGTFQVSTSLGGPAVNTTGSQSGTQSVQSGSDTNTGLSIDVPFLTTQKCVETVANTLIINGVTVTCRRSNGTYNETVFLLPYVGSYDTGSVALTVPRVIGASQAGVKHNCSSLFNFLQVSNFSVWYLDAMTLACTGGTNVMSDVNGVIYVGNLTIGAGGTKFLANVYGSFIEFLSGTGITLTTGGGSFASGQSGGQILSQGSNVVNSSGTITMSNAFLVAGGSSRVDLSNTTWSGGTLVGPQCDAGGSPTTGVGAVAGCTAIPSTLPTIVNTRIREANYDA